MGDVYFRVARVPVHLCVHVPLPWSKRSLVVDVCCPPWNLRQGFQLQGWRGVPGDSSLEFAGAHICLHLRPHLSEPHGGHHPSQRAIHLLVPLMGQRDRLGLKRIGHLDLIALDQKCVPFDDVVPHLAVWSLALLFGLHRLFFAFKYRAELRVVDGTIHDLFHCDCGYHLLCDSVDPYLSVFFLGLYPHLLPLFPCEIFGNWVWMS